MMYHHLLPCLKCRIHGEYLRGVEKGPPIYLEKLVEGLVERNIPSMQKCKGQWQQVLAISVRVVLC